MKRIFYGLLSVMLAVFVMSNCTKNTRSSNIPRPIDNWVFRTVLDGNPRMITMALSDNLWVAYHVGTGAMYKAWKGSVYFDGAVYASAAHGPQPISVGNAYVENTYKQPWYVLKGSDTVAIKYDYKGHRFVDGHAELMYQLSAPTWTKPISISERVEVAQSKAGSTILERTFTTANVPDGIKIGMKFNAASIVSESNISTDGKLEGLKKTDVKYDDVNAITLDGSLVLNSNKTTTFHTTFMQTPTVENKNVAGGLVEEEEENPGGIPPGLKLIAKSDCKTCHNKNVQTIGPAYTAIAEKYANTPENIALLASKVKKGGSGVWGEQMMTPHPDLDDADLKEMVTYIMSLDDDSKTEQKTQALSAPTLEPDASVKDDDMLAGAITKIYDIPSTTSKMPTVTPKMKPKFGGVLADFDNISGSGFVGLTEHFMLQSTGYLNIQQEGEYILQVWSDDGSIVYLNNQVIMNNDGNHGVEYKDYKVVLKKGFYPFRIDYYQGGGGNYLAVDWKKPGDKEYEVIPKANIVHHKKDSQQIKDMSLPMATATKIPGDQQPLTEVHPSFDLQQARPGGFRPKVGGMDFKKDGRLIVSTWDPEGSVYILDKVATGDTTQMTYKRIAFGLAEPLGVKVVNDTIYVMQKQEMTRLIDTDGDDIIDEYQTLCDDWGATANFHEFGFGLAYKDGYFYATLATAINPGGASTKPQHPDRGKVVKVNKNTGEMSFVASGLRTPNGVGVGYGGDIYVADNQGDWLPASKIVHVRDGAWFGSRSVDSMGSLKLTEALPLVWLPQDEIGNSPSTPLALDLGIYKGQMIHGEVTHGGVKRVFVEEVNGVRQGCVFRFIQGLEAGVNRMCWGPDGALYVGGIGNPGNWGHTGKLRYGLQRLAFNKKSTFEMLAVRAKANGMEIEFTEPVGAEASNKNLYEIKQWYYKPTHEYGGPKLGEKNLTVKSVTVSADQKKVFVEYDGQKANHMIYIHLKRHFISQLGQQIWSTEAWYTMNQVATTMGEIKPSTYDFAANTLHPNEVKDGWKLLFDGKSLNGWRNYGKQTLGKSWIVQDNAIHLNTIIDDKGTSKAADGGDIITLDKYKDFEFSTEWKISSCGNSGIFFNVVEDTKKYGAVYSTGPEMQVLDNTCHPDSRYEKHRAGDLYDMIACREIAVKAAGQWNEARIRSHKGKVDFWLNGYRIVSFNMGDDRWRELIKSSKFKDWNGFGMSTDGHIALQDHGDKVWYRNIKVRPLK
jgi:cytochrome c